MGITYFDLLTVSVSLSQALKTMLYTVMFYFYNKLKHKKTTIKIHDQVACKDLSGGLC